MPKIIFKTKSGKGTKFGGLKVQKFAAPGQPVSAIKNVKLTNGAGSLQLDAASTYTLFYGFFGEPGGTFEIVVSDEDGNQILDESDKIPDDKLAESDKLTFATP